MTRSRPPHVADWLLDRLASGPKRHSLIGDLHEQYDRGRSAAWYWRQVLVVIVASVAWDIRHHLLFAVRTVALTYLFLIPWIFFTGYVYGSTKWWMEDHVLHGVIPFHDVWVIYQAPLLLAWCFGSTLIGWLIATAHPRNRAGMTTMAVCALIPWTAAYTLPIWRLANAGLPFFASFPAITNVAIVAVGMPVSLVSGSVFAASSLSRNG